MRQLTNSSKAVACLASLALFFFAVPLPSTAQSPGYILTDLGTLSGPESKAFGVNRSARVVGESTATTPGVKKPFAWNSGVLTDLTTFGGNNGSAYAVNDIGYAVGAADTTTGQTHPFIWSDIFDKKDLGTLSGGTFAIALDINNANQIVGQSEIGGPGVLQDRAFVWDKTNGIQAIATLGGSSNAARGINDVGKIVGYSGTSDGATHGFLLSGGVLTDIPTLGTGRVGIANEINNSGQVVGYSTIVTGPLNPPYHAFLWTAGNSPSDLGTLGGNFSIAFDINEASEIVGTSEVTPGVYHAFIYTQLTGMTDLNSLTAGSGWTLTDARSINDKGQIVGFGVNPSGFVHGYLLSPAIDEIPGGEPPPCSVVTANPIVLPPTAPVTRGGVRLIPRSPVPSSGRKPIYDLLKL